MENGLYRGKVLGDITWLGTGEGLFSLLAAQRTGCPAWAECAELEPAPAAARSAAAPAAASSSCIAKMPVSKQLAQGGRGGFTLPERMDTLDVSVAFVESLTIRQLRPIAWFLVCWYS